jgi:hypothetical protein
VLVECTAGWGLIQTDCTMFGQHCASANGASACTNGATCDPTMPTHCEGNRLVECDSATKLESSIDCGAMLSGGGCVTMTMGSSRTVGCFPPASASCPLVESVHCDGTAGVVCEPTLFTDPGLKKGDVPRGSA